jgi:enoyl-CoA hydratase
MSAYRFYEVEKQPPLAWVWLNRPEKKNAMNPPAWHELPPIMADLDADDAVRVVVVAARGEAFCAGIDLVAMAAELPELMEKDQKGGVKRRLLRKLYPLQETMTCLERCAKPVIAAIHGYCVGAGLDLATACDIRICSADAVFSLREAAVAFVADVGVLQRLPLIVGQGMARELAFTARNIDAGRAREILLVNQVFADREALMAGAADLARRIAANSPLAVQATKEVMNFGVGKSVDDGLKYVATRSANIIPSDDFTEAITAFMEKRKPEFPGT